MREWLGMADDKAREKGIMMMLADVNEAERIQWSLIAFRTQSL
jgi:hypothetical protein